MRKLEERPQKLWKRQHRMVSHCDLVLLPINRPSCLTLPKKYHYKHKRPESRHLTKQQQSHSCSIGLLVNTQPELVEQGSQRMSSRFRLSSMLCHSKNGVLVNSKD